MRILVDTNILVSGLVAKGACFEILEDLVYTHTPLYTSHIIKECEDVLFNKLQFSPPTVNVLLAVIKNHYHKGLSATKAVNVCRDPEDNQVLADAQLNKVDFILTGDKDLLSLGTFEGIPIISPGEYWKI
ncbi:MAG: putative toxin-antitoxin system toxin component, PIN family [Candidatus Omnitrophica bacterium]|nr:putative toxin-antitoxin system toxin component, PIN family [Candidatus Omnitrophota bacterium]MDE2010501.1 putative toxin-antitoxin system toxin component, PIN family [Candidatus Omnitrophota bacterium]MDE2232365.1 putative toxin-antitoxin system toxin component, PIN family [Candidatus Omnitrophota bacterium]